MAAVSIQERVSSLEKSIQALIQSTQKNKDKIDENARAISELVEGRKERLQSLFSSLHHVSPLCRVWSLSAFAHIPLIKAFQFATVADLANINAVCRQWRNLSHEIVVQESVYLAHARLHEPLIYEKYVNHTMGGAAIVFLIKQKTGVLKLQEEADEISEGIEAVKEETRHLAISVTLQSMAVTGIGLALISSTSQVVYS